MKTILLTGARAPATLDFARALSNAGHRVIAAESLLYPLSIRSRAFSKFCFITAPNTSRERFIEDLIRIIETEKVDLLIPTCEEVFHVAHGLKRLQSKTKVLCSAPETLTRLHSKVEFNSWMHDLKITAPITTRVSSREAMATAIQSLPGARVVLKPEFSRFATKTLILEQQAALEECARLSIKQPWAVQECLQGTEYCSYSLAKDGELLAHVTYDHEFTAGKGAGICFRSLHHEGIETWVRDFIKATRFTGQIAFDFIDDGKGTIQALECNPRATSGLHLIAHHPGFIDILFSDPESDGTPIRPNAGEQGQLRLAMLAYGLPSIRSIRSGLSWIKTFFFAREVIFDLRDPWPFLDQFRTFIKLIRTAKALNVTPLEVSTQDIEWNGT